MLYVSTYEKNNDKENEKLPVDNDWQLTSTIAI